MPALPSVRTHDVGVVVNDTLAPFAKSKPPAPAGSVLLQGAAPGGKRARRLGAGLMRRLGAAPFGVNLSCGVEI